MGDKPWGWGNSDRRDRLPSNWKSVIVPEVKRRAMGICQSELPSGARCGRKGTDVDHIRPGDNHSYANLQLLCPRHHQIKTDGEKLAGRMKFKPKRRPVEGHPSEF